VREIKKCPKCSGKMKPREPAGGAGEWAFKFRLKKLETNDFLGDKIHAFYCEDCGYIEFYKEMKKQKDS